MPEIKSRHTHFVKRLLTADPEHKWEADINVPFDVDDVIVRLVLSRDIQQTATLAADGAVPAARVLREKHYLLSLYMHGIGDLCGITSNTQMTPNTVFPVNGRISGAQRFSLRNMDGGVTNGVHAGSILVQLDFVRYVRPDSPLHHKPPLMK